MLSFYPLYISSYLFLFLFITTRYDFNDSHVSSTSPERAISNTAYVLFYKRR